MNNYVLFYKTGEKSSWQSIHIDENIEKWGNYARQQNYAKYDIIDLKKYDAQDLHLLTDIILYNNKYYLYHETIPYPTTETKTQNDFQITLEVDENNKYDDMDYEEAYQKKGFDRGFGQLWTNVLMSIYCKNQIIEKYIVAQEFIKYVPEFLEKLEEKGFAVYINLEYSQFKWLAWLKGDRLRIIQQNYDARDVIEDFDLEFDKNQFVKMIKKMIVQLEKYAKTDFERYEQYVRVHHNSKD